jgi:Group II intron, maturase-specific domain
VLIRLNQIMRGWANYFKHAVCKHTLNAIDNFMWHRFTWHRVIRWWMRLHRWQWKEVRRRLIGPNGRWRRPAADGIELFNIASVPVTRYRYRGSKILTPGHCPTTPNGRNHGEPAERDRHGGLGGRPGKRTGSSRHRAPGRLNHHRLRSVAVPTAELPPVSTVNPRNGKPRSKVSAIPSAAGRTHQGLIDDMLVPARLR